MDKLQAAEIGGVPYYLFKCSYCEHRMFVPILEVLWGVDRDENIKSVFPHKFLFDTYRDELYYKTGKNSLFLMGIKRNDQWMCVTVHCILDRKNDGRNVQAQAQEGISPEVSENTTL
jgi:hypothetical protein